jgi:hypothetical protein
MLWIASSQRPAHIQRTMKALALVAGALLSLAASAQAHGIAGNRYFPGTLTFDDPAVADELFIPVYSRLEHPTREGGEASDDSFSVTFQRLLTRTLAVGGDTGLGVSFTEEGGPGSFSSMLSSSRPSQREQRGSLALMRISIPMGTEAPSDCY